MNEAIQHTPDDLARLGAPIRVLPQLRERVWGGRRLRSDGPPIGEAWVVHTESPILAGPGAGRTLGELARTWGVPLVGQRVFDLYGASIPLLIKLIDAAEWLSIQVHPDDRTAQRLEGPGHAGKTEAWYVLAADEGTEIIAGTRGDASASNLAHAIATGTIMDQVARLAVSPGQTVFIPAGTLHALGPGIFVYEVQQHSDLTYRVYDWGRPASAGRELHLRQAMVSVDPAARPQLPAPVRTSDVTEMLISCSYFCLERVTVTTSPAMLDTRGQSFHAVTVIEGAMTVRAAGGQAEVATHETVVIPACAGAYALMARESPAAQALVARVP